MQQIDEVGNFRVETQTHRRFVNNFAGVVANHRNAQNFVRLVFGMSVYREIAQDGEEVSPVGARICVLVITSHSIIAGLPSLRMKNLSRVL
jgi:hypothetical protein